MKRLWSCVVVAVLLAISIVAARDSRADDKPGMVTEIHLITMGQGEHLFTRGGHASILVARLSMGVPKETLVYNFGNADWDNPHLVREFFLGKLEFFLATSGSLTETINDYGHVQKRETWRQKLFLTNEQAVEVAARLERNARPENRAYRYHHYKAICTTKINDLLDDVLKGELRRQLSGPSGVTVRDIQETTFSAHHGVAIAGDLFLGRIHDQPIDRYMATFVPWRMSDELQTVMVSNPNGPGLVPLASPRIPLTELATPPLPKESSIATVVAGLVSIALLAIFGLSAFRLLPGDSVGAGYVVAVPALLFGLVGAIIVGLMLVSSVPELRLNENVVLFPPTDLALVFFGVRWIRGRSGIPKVLRLYAIGRLVVPVLALLLHLTHVFYQKPLVLVFVSITFGAVLTALTARVPQARPTAPSSSEAL